MRDALAGAVRVLSVLPDELPAAIEKLQAEARDRQKTVTALQQDLARYRAEELAARTRRRPRRAGSWRAPSTRTRNGLKSLASAIVSTPGHIAVLVSDVAGPRWWSSRDRRTCRSRPTS